MYEHYMLFTRTSTSTANGTSMCHQICTDLHYLYYWICVVRTYYWH